MKKIFVITFISLLTLSLLPAHPARETEKSGYVASTSWVAAIAELAGMDGVETIAPASLSHPPEYEITPDDIVKVMEADIFMYAGYEKMMDSIRNASGRSEENSIKVKTTNTLSNLESMVKMLSGKAGTESKAEERFSRYRSLIEEARRRIASSPNRNIEVWANTNQAEFARDLGLNVVSTFGSGPLTSSQIEEAYEKKYPLIIDNVHNPVASPAGEVSSQSTILVWRNFPDHTGGDALYSVVKDNLDALWETGLF